MERFDAIFKEEKSLEARGGLKKIRKFPALCLLLVHYDAMLAEFAPSQGKEFMDDKGFAQANLAAFQQFSKELLAIPDKAILSIAFRLIFCVQQIFLKDFKVEKLRMKFIFDQINFQYLQNEQIFCSNLEAFFLGHHHAEDENPQETLTKKNEADISYLLFNEYKGKRKALLRALKNSKWFHYFHKPHTLFDHPDVQKIINCKKEYLIFLAFLFSKLAKANYIQARKGKGFMECLCKYILCDGKEIKGHQMNTLLGKIKLHPEKYCKCTAEVDRIMEMLHKIKEVKS